jgi:hypothetical protein
MDGGSVGGFRWQRVESKAQLDGRCQTLPEERGGVELPVPLRLGISEDGVSHIFSQLHCEAWELYSLSA